MTCSCVHCLRHPLHTQASSVECFQGLTSPGTLIEPKQHVTRHYCVTHSHPALKQHDQKPLVLPSTSCDELPTHNAAGRACCHALPADSAAADAAQKACSTTCRCCCHLMPHSTVLCCTSVGFDESCDNIAITASPAGTVTVQECAKCPQHTSPK
jgi:hypothetical protein